MPEANTLEGALAEAAFLTGVERNADVVWLASYAPLFARLGYAQWSPDMIWFNGASCYGSPSYYVQKMFACNMGDVTLDLHGTDKKARETGLYCSAGLDKKSGEIIVKIVNSAEEERGIELALCGEAAVGCAVRALILTGPKRDACNSMEAPEKIAPYEREYTDLNKIVLPPLSFAVLRAGREK